MKGNMSSIFVCSEFWSNVLLAVKGVELEEVTLFIFNLRPSLKGRVPLQWPFHEVVWEETICRRKSTDYGYHLTYYIQNKREVQINIRLTIKKYNQSFQQISIAYIT